MVNLGFLMNFVLKTAKMKQMCIRDRQASAPNASLEKFSTDSLQHYKTIFLVLSIIAYLLTVMCFFNSSFLFGFLLLLVGLFFTGT